MTAVPADRLAPIISSYVAGFHDDRDRYGIGGYTALAELVAGLGASVSVSTKTLKRIVNGRQRTVDFARAEAILAALDQLELWHLPPSAGGLSDVWDALDLGAAEPLELQGSLFDLDVYEAAA